MILLRFILINLAIYLIIRSVIRSLTGTEKKEDHFSQGEEKRERWTFREKGVSKEVGEYIDYEEVDKKKP
ncbi:MAG TPA: hypothetical protein PLR88_00510 [Bacteroidales bacterium]|nr:hypothetical protein [Bacteroidales bacterium]HPT20397.1 hypothetical protein [Bacteroidales bacterium]